MAHNHSHGGCGDGCDDHGIPESEGPRDNIYLQIDKDNIVALNAANGQGKEVIKPWHERVDEEVYLESDADDQMIIRVPFTGSVKLRAILLKSGPSDYTPVKMAVFSNIDHLDFSEIVDRKPAQEFDVAQSRDVGEYHVMPAKFPNVTSITMYFPASQGADTVRVYYIGFLGQWSERNDKPVIAVYEARANPADHKAIREIDGGAINTSGFDPASAPFR